MEDLTVVYFVMDKEAAARQHKRRPWQYRVESRIIVSKPAQVTLVRVYLPEYSLKKMVFKRYCRKQAWTAGDWQQYWEGLPIPPEGREVYYYYEKQAQEFLGRRAEPLPWDWVLFLMAYYRVEFDALVLLQDRDMEAWQMVQEYAAVTRYLGVATSRPEDWQDMVESLSEEYGFLLDVSRSVKSLHIPLRGKTLVIAGEETYGAAPSSLPEGCIWISTDTEGGAGRNVCARVQDAEYIGMKRFLRKFLRRQP